MGNDHTHDSRDDERTVELGRRPFLGALGALGATGTMGTAAGRSAGDSILADHVDEWASPDDPYYASLVDEFQGMGLPPGEFVYAENAADTLAAYEVAGSAATVSSIDPGDDVPFEEAQRVEISGDVTNPWDVTMIGEVPDRAVETGDVLLGVAYFRSPTAGDDSRTEVQYVSKDEDNLSSNMVRNANMPALDTEWTRYFFQIQFDYSSEAGTWWTEIFMGYGQQTVDVGGLALLDFDQDVSLDELPDWQPSYEYPGREVGATWRQQAQDRIDELRKADLEITVVDADGNPVDGADVDVTMQNHEFGFGSAFSVSYYTGDFDYRQTFLENFNKAVPENGLKVPAWEGRYGESLGPQNTRQAISRLTNRGIPIRGHTLLWEEYDWMGISPDLPQEDINETVKQKIEERAAEFSGDLVEWDMHNHPIWQSNIRDDLGQEVLTEWWDVAREADPEAEMYVNEMNIIAGSSYRDAYEDLIQWYQDNEVGLDGIGFMGHFNINSLQPPEEILSVFDRFGEHGVPLQITEFDVQLDDRGSDAQVQAQVDYVRDVLTAAFSHEAVETVMSWGFWAGNHWRPSAAYYDTDWSIRPHGEEYQRLVFDEWWTDESGEADADGNYGLSGFKGDYEITATDGNRSGTATATLSDGGTSVEVAISEAAGTDTPTTTDGSPTATATATDGEPMDEGTATPTATETDGQPGLGILSGLAGIAGLAGYALSRRRDDEE